MDTPDLCVTRIPNRTFARPYVSTPFRSHARSEFERDMIRERTRAGLAAAHKRGVSIGRPRALTPEQILMAKAMTADPSISIRQVAEQFGIHRSTLYRHLNARQKRSA